MSRVDYRERTSHPQEDGSLGQPFPVGLEELASHRQSLGAGPGHRPRPLLLCGHGLGATAFLLCGEVSAPSCYRKRRG